MSIPEASAIETVEAPEAPTMSPVEAFFSHMTALEARLDYIKKDLTKEMEAELKAMQKLAKKLIKQPRKPKAPKEEGAAAAPASAWNAFIADTLVQMKAEGWPAYVVKEKSYPGGVQNDESVWIVDDEEVKRRVPPTYRQAMTYAAFRKANGEYAGDPDAEARKAEKAAEKAAKKAEREAEKAAKKPAAGGAGKKAAEPKAAAAKPVAKPVTKAEPKAKAEPAAKPAAKAPAKAAAPAKAPAKPAAPAVVSDDEALVTLKKWTFKGKKYFRSSENGVWTMKPDGSQGAWAGKYDAVSDSIDETAEEPEYGSDEE
jgi:hypothetical protein